MKKLQISVSLVTLLFSTLSFAGMFSSKDVVSCTVIQGVNTYNKARAVGCDNFNLSPISWRSLSIKLSDDGKGKAMSYSDANEGKFYKYEV